MQQPKLYSGSTSQASSPPRSHGLAATLADNTRRIGANLSISPPTRGLRNRAISFNKLLGSTIYLWGHRAASPSFPRKMFQIKEESTKALHPLFFELCPVSISVSIPTHPWMSISIPPETSAMCIRKVSHFRNPAAGQMNQWPQVGVNGGNSTTQTSKTRHCWMSNFWVKSPKLLSKHSPQWKPWWEV